MDAINIINFAQQGLPFVRFAAGLFPGGGALVAALEMASPILSRIAAVAPIALDLIGQGRPIYESVVAAGPDMLPNIKKAYAVINGGVGGAASVPDETALRFAGPVLLGRAWTPEEEERLFTIAKGDIGAIR